jgi:hypothetical protein
MTVFGKVSWYGGALSLFVRTAEVFLYTQNIFQVVGYMPGASRRSFFFWPFLYLIVTVLISWTCAMNSFLLLDRCHKTADFVLAGTSEQAAVLAANNRKTVLSLHVVTMLSSDKVLLSDAPALWSTAVAAQVHDVDVVCIVRNHLSCGMPGQLVDQDLELALLVTTLLSQVLRPVLLWNLHHRVATRIK